MPTTRKHRKPPVNRTSKAERKARWKEAAAACIAAGAIKITGEKHARYTWVKLIKAEGNGLAPLTRLLALVIADHGRADGSNIFPGVRMLAKETGMSQNSVTTHLDRLVRSGYLWRQQRDADVEWRTSFVYWLSAPKSVVPTAAEATPIWEDDRDWTPRPSIPTSEPARIPTAARAAALTASPTAATAAAPTAASVAASHADDVWRAPEKRYTKTDSAIDAASGERVPQTAGLVPQMAARGAANGEANCRTGCGGSYSESSDSVVSKKEPPIRASSATMGAHVSKELTEEEKRAKICTLHLQGWQPHEIVKALAQYNVNVEDVRRALET